MHELSLAQEIIINLQAQMCKNLSDIVHMTVRVGTLSGVVADSLHFGLQCVLQENFAENTSIEIIMEPAQASCECGNHYIITDLFCGCPKCGSFLRSITGGKEVIVESIELKD